MGFVINVEQHRLTPFFDAATETTITEISPTTDISAEPSFLDEWLEFAELLYGGAL